MTEPYESDIASAFPRGVESATPVVLVHGTATDGRVWTSGPHGDRTQALLDALAASGRTVLTPTRPQSGDLDAEVDFLAPLCAGALVVGVSGGATLGLELLARGVPLAGAVLHEPAAGSLLPGLLAHVVAGLADGGVAGLGRALYGPLWEASMTTASLATVRAELAMFSAFEPTPFPAAPLPAAPFPAAPLRASGVLLTVGERSPQARHRSVALLRDLLGVPTVQVPGISHAAHLEGATGTLLRSWHAHQATARSPHAP